MGKLLQEAAGDPRTLEMLARCVEAAARSLDEEKIDLLARIFVSGERDTAKVDEASILVEAVRQLEAPHLRLLSILAELGPTLCQVGLQRISRNPIQTRPRSTRGEWKISWRRILG